METENLTTSLQRSENKKAPPIVDLTKTRGHMLSAIGATNERINFLRSQQAPFESAIKNYQTGIESVKGKYTKFFMDHQKIAEHAKAPTPSFDTEEGIISKAENLLNISGMMSTPNIAALESQRNRTAMQSAALKDRIQENKDAVDALDKLIAEAKTLSTCSIENTEDKGRINEAYLKSIDTKYGSPNQSYLSGALTWFGGPGEKLEGRPSRHRLNAEYSGDIIGELKKVGAMKDKYGLSSPDDVETKLGTIEKDIETVESLELDKRLEGLAAGMASVEKIEKSLSLTSLDVLDKLKTHKQTAEASRYALGGSPLTGESWQKVKTNYGLLVTRNQEMKKREQAGVTFFTQAARRNIRTDKQGNPIYSKTFLKDQNLFLDLPFSSDKLNEAWAKFDAHSEKIVGGARKNYFAKKIPFEQIRIAGLFFDEKGVSDAAKLDQFDLLSGHIELEGLLKDDIKSDASEVWVSLDGGKNFNKRAKINNGKVEFKWKPEGRKSKSYWVKLKVKFSDQTLSDPFPWGGHGAGVHYYFDAEDRPILRRIKIAGRVWDNIDGVMTLNQDDVTYDGIKVTGYAKGRVGHFDDKRGKGQTKLQVSHNGGGSWKNIPLFDGDRVKSPWSYSWRPQKGEYKLVFRLINPSGLTSAPEDCDPITVRYENKTSEDSVKKTMRKLVEAFERKDIPGFMAEVSPDFYGGDDILRDQLRRFFDSVHTIRLYVVPNLYQVKRKRIVLNTHWERTLVETTTSNQIRQSGDTVFLFDRDTKKVMGFKGDDLFVPLSDTGSPITGSGLQVKRGTLNEHTLAGMDSSAFDISADQASAIEYGDFYWLNFQMELYADGGGAIDLGAKELDEVTSVPSGGYSTSPVSLAEGHTYAIKTREGTYAAVYMDSFTGAGPDVMQFEYKYQSDGTTNLP
ncbi:hypothetical protein BVX98_05545 [bacterium F11]|nr:hypothetical protein BVX98_05545 [bacterium F11]